MLRNLPPSLRRIVANTGWLFVDRVVRMGLGVFVGVWVARYLGPSRFGILNFAISFVAVFGTIAALGLDNVAIKNILAQPADTPEILGTTLALRLAASISAALLTVPCVLLIQPNDRATMVIVSLLAVGLVFQAFDTIDLYFQSQVRSKLTVWAKNISFLLCATFRVILIRASAPLWLFAIAQTAEFALGAAGLLLAYRLTGGRLFLWRTSLRRAGLLLGESWPLLLSGMAILIYMRLDMVMLKVMQGDRAVGIYAAATRISEVWYFIPVAVVSSVSPAIIRAKGDPALYYRRLGKLFSLMSVLAICIGSVAALASHWIVHALYSDAFKDAGPVLAVHVWASVFVFLGTAQIPWTMAENLYRPFFYRSVAGAVTNVALNLVLIPKYSAVGAALATLISYAVASVFFNAFDARTRPIFLLQIRSILPRNLWELRKLTD